jgi:MtN3 and saliva related transmembrane protein
MRRGTRPRHEITMSDPLMPTAWLGYAAATCTTLSFLPQALLTLRTRRVEGISLSMYSAFTCGVALWLWYGWRLGEWPIIVANFVTLVLAATILGTKLWVEHGPGKAVRPRRTNTFD